MERSKMSSQDETSIQHSSHPHPLQLSNYQPQQPLNKASCSGCNLTVLGWTYSCNTCNYFLHIKCAKFPEQITHPFHQGHVLSLLPKPIYPDGYFSCDACGKPGKGFSYHCKLCNYDIHAICASMPLALTHQSHPHQLKLTISPPYFNKSYRCDICQTDGCNHWLYRCNPCGFDAHLSCASGQAPMIQPNQTATGSDPLQALLEPVEAVLQRIRLEQRQENAASLAIAQQIQNQQLQQAAATQSMLQQFLNQQSPNNQYEAILQKYQMQQSNTISSQFNKIQGLLQQFQGLQSQSQPPTSNYDPLQSVLQQIQNQQPQAGSIPITPNQAQVADFTTVPSLQNSMPNISGNQQGFFGSGMGQNTDFFNHSVLQTGGPGISQGTTSNGGGGGLGTGLDLSMIQAIMGGGSNSISGLDIFGNGTAGNVDSTIGGLDVFGNTGGGSIGGDSNFTVL